MHNSSIYFSSYFLINTQIMLFAKDGQKYSTLYPGIMDRWLTNQYLICKEWVMISSDPRGSLINTVLYRVCVCKLDNSTGLETVRMNNEKWHQ